MTKTKEFTHHCISPDCISLDQVKYDSKFKLWYLNVNADEYHLQINFCPYCGMELNHE